mmetsp:Transcript_91437/g.217876  ORF Transcript_91437/g.217876 Transcript_91437/m.217876 type:complete len:202 (-) Transcript_91437:780-1385(-)
MEGGDQIALARDVLCAHRHQVAGLDRCAGQRGDHIFGELLGTRREGSLAQQHGGILVSLFIHLGIYMVRRPFAQRLDVGCRGLLQADDGSIAVAVEYSAGEGVLPAEGRLTDGALDLLPVTIWREHLQHVHQHSIEDGEAKALQRHRHRLLLLGDCRIFGLLDGGEHLAGTDPLCVAVLASLHLQLLLEDELGPLRPPLCH